MYSTLSAPDQPNAVIVTSTTATNISLSWSVFQGSLESYELVWERDTTGRCSEEDKDSITITDGSTRYQIVGLEEDSNYTITVRVNTPAGSAVSDPITGMTKEAGEGLNGVGLGKAGEIHSFF